MIIFSYWEYLHQLVVFSVNDIAKILQKKPQYAKIYLYRLKKKGILIQIERNKYTFEKDPFIFASKIYIPSYISLLTAMRYHNMTTQFPQNIDLITPSRQDTLKFQKIFIQFHRSSHFWGYSLYPYHDYLLPIADPEKSLIDCIEHKIPLHFIYEGITMHAINKKRMITYLQKLHNKSLIKRIGFILDQGGLDIYKDLHPFLDANYVILDRNGPSHGLHNKKWRIIENLVLS